MDSLQKITQMVNLNGYDHSELLTLFATVPVYVSVQHASFCAVCICAHGMFNWGVRRMVWENIWWFPMYVWMHVLVSLFLRIAIVVVPGPSSLHSNLLFAFWLMCHWAEDPKCLLQLMLRLSVADESYAEVQDIKPVQHDHSQKGGIR